MDVVDLSGACVAAFTRRLRDTGASARTALRGVNKFQRARVPAKATTPSHGGRTPLALGAAAAAGYASCSRTRSTFPMPWKRLKNAAYRNPNWKSRMKGRVPKISLLAA